MRAVGVTWDDEDTPTVFVAERIAHEQTARVYLRRSRRGRAMFFALGVAAGAALAELARLVL